MTSITKPNIGSGIIASTFSDEAVIAHRKEWVNALRSGDFQQTKQRLHDGVGYCCLGVACRLAGIAMTENNDGYDEITYVFDDDYLTLPTRGQDWLGVDNGNPVLDIPPRIVNNPQNKDASHARDVASLNDEGFSFNQIADLIEYFGFIEPDVF